MLKIVAENVVRLGGATFDYELEDGTLLHESEWNGECYTAREWDGEAYVVKSLCYPVYSKTSNENNGHDVVGFERR